LAVCVVVALLTWLPVSAFPRIPVASLDRLFGCEFLIPGTPLMSGCVVALALALMLVPLAITVLAFVVLRRLRFTLRHHASTRVPDPLRFVALPAVVTFVFALSWTYVHQATATSWGLLPNMLFPALVGLFSFGAVEYGAAAEERLRGFRQFRDRVPFRVRVVATVLIPSLIAFWLIADGDALGALKQQLIALAEMVIGLLLLMRPEPQPGPER
jgi:hypothetical protein